MSDQYGSYDYPFNVPPPFPQQPGTPPPPPYASYPPPRPPMTVHGAVPTQERRPGAVTTAAVITFVLSGLMLAVLVLAALGLFLARTQPDPGDDPMSGAELIVALVGLGAAGGVTVLAIVMAALALARRQGPRITLVALSFLYAPLVMLLGVGLIVDGADLGQDGEIVAGVLTIIGGLLPALCGVLLLLPAAGRWYRGRVRR